VHDHLGDELLRKKINEKAKRASNIPTAKQQRASFLALAQKASTNQQQQTGNKRGSMFGGFSGFGSS
jgi:hypothetical protein